MPCGWEGNRMSGVALAMRHRLQWFIHLRAHDLDSEIRRIDVDVAKLWAQAMTPLCPSLQYSFSQSYQIQLPTKPHFCFPEAPRLRCLVEYGPLLPFTICSLDIHRGQKFVPRKSAPS